MRLLLPHHASKGRRKPRAAVCDRNALRASTGSCYSSASRWVAPVVCGPLKGSPHGRSSLPTPCEWIVQRPIWLTLISLPTRWKQPISNSLCRPGRPGRYAIYDFAKNVQEFSAEGADGHPLPWIKLDKQTWRVDAGQAGGTVHVHYQVFANDLTGSFSQVDSVHANLNGPSVFMYVDGHKPDPITLSIEAPAGWKVISGFSTSTTERTFRARNYDLPGGYAARNLRRMLPRPVSRAGEDHRGCGAYLQR